VVINLLVNAVDALSSFTRTDKAILVITGSRDNSCFLEVLDNGPGIPESFLNNIFDPFFTTKIGSEGMGLGLSICHNIVSGFGGTITASNRPEGGARFAVTIPVASEAGRTS
jgi:C4-dicarboxylate-specific signal transduction histidine kinase